MCPSGSRKSLTPLASLAKCRKGNRNSAWISLSCQKFPTPTPILLLCYITDHLSRPDPFVKIQLVHGLKLAKTKKTSFIKGTIDPFYNESFSFKVPQEELENASLVFTGMFAKLL